MSSWFRKEIGHVGVYLMRDKTLDITLDMLYDLLTAFQVSGMKVWIPMGHSRLPEDNAGWVRNLYVEGEGLFAIMEITDTTIARKIQEGSIADVSMGIEQDVYDGTGKRWPNILRHVALTLDPAIKCLSGFEEATLGERVLAS
jgi:hypothetical protein